MFFVSEEGHTAADIPDLELGLKPMNCPAHCLIFKHAPKSHRELPVRMADFSALHRNEASGALTGLTRVRQFHQDDGHVFCTEHQITDEVRKCLDFVDKVYSTFGFTYTLKLSTRPDSYMGELAVWQAAEEHLESALESFGKPWIKNPGDGAFYGPKIDIVLTDALGRQHQTATIQLDFQLPERFELEYAAAEENVMHRPVMIHRAIFGSFERFFAILCEHTEGKWPLWLSPRQVLVCPVSEAHAGYAHDVAESIRNASFHTDVDASNETLGKRLRRARGLAYNYVVVVGNEEMEMGTISVKPRDQDVLAWLQEEEEEGELNVQEFVAKMELEMQRSLGAMVD